MCVWSPVHVFWCICWILILQSFFVVRLKMMFSTCVLKHPMQEVQSGMTGCLLVRITMCREAGIVGKKTNHSLRATVASALFNAGAPEKLIREGTGHTSNVLELYERPMLEQRQKVSSILMQGKQSFNQPQGKENVAQPWPQASVNVGSFFFGVTGSSIMISAQNFTVNVQLNQQRWK